MKYVDEFRDPDKASALLKAIVKISDELSGQLKRPVYIMEVCGGHTHSIFRYGIESMLPDSIELIHGPGCPVCVLPMGRVDDCVAIAEKENVIFTTFGDAIRVPGSKKSLLRAKADGADVRMVYSIFFRRLAKSPEINAQMSSQCRYDCQHYFIDSRQPKFFR